MDNTFQSPSHRGGGAAGVKTDLCGTRLHSFNPLLIGEAAPPESILNTSDFLSMFQSPSHRGGGAAMGWCTLRRPGNIWFQSPSHRGGGAAAGKGYKYTITASNVSIPFSSGRRRRLGINSVSGGSSKAFQSPSHRGGGAAGFAWPAVSGC